MTFAELVAENARAFIGKILETYPYQNRSPILDGLCRWAQIPVGEPWCALFAAFVIALLSGGKIPANFAACASWPITHTKDPQPGDVVLFNFENGTVAHHCGIVVDVLPDRILTAEGNTSIIPKDREGYGVFLKQHSPDTMGNGILGYYRPTEN